MKPLPSPFRQPILAMEIATKHIKKCQVAGCETCVVALELRAEQELTASYRKGAEESGRRWDLLDAHEQLKAAEHIKWSEEHAKLSAEHDDLKRRLDGVRYWLDVKDTITGDR